VKSQKEVNLLSMAIQSMFGINKTLYVGASGELETLGDVILSDSEVSSNSSLAERVMVSDRPRLALAASEKSPLRALPFPPLGTLTGLAASET
jgi:hypothetical protein